MNSKQIGETVRQQSKIWRQLCEPVYMVPATYILNVQKGCSGWDTETMSLTSVLYVDWQKVPLKIATEWYFWIPMLLKEMFIQTVIDSLKENSCL